MRWLHRLRRRRSRCHLLLPDESKAILALHTYGHDTPARLPFAAALARGFREGGVKVDLYIETLDASRFAGEAYTRLMRDYLRGKYAGKKIAVIIAVDDCALAFLLDERDPLLPAVPIAAWTRRAPSSSRAGLGYQAW